VYEAATEAVGALERASWRDEHRLQGFFGPLHWAEHGRFRIAEQVTAGGTVEVAQRGLPANAQHAERRSGRSLAQTIRRPSRWAVAASAEAPTRNASNHNRGNAARSRACSRGPAAGRRSVIVSTTRRPAPLEGGVGQHHRETATAPQPPAGEGTE